ncbi:MAG: NAD(+) diphosphatase [Clostridia bacterium]|nr:NAD(+) diphosphatase [Clostridia bacterium]
MIQDIFPHKLNNAFRSDLEPTAQSIVFLFQNDAIWVGSGNEGFKLPHVGELDAQIPLRYLFTLDDTACFLGEMGEGAQCLPARYAPLSVRKLRHMEGDAKAMVFAAWTAYQLNNWYSDNRYCGRCGSKTTLATDERAVVCPKCNRRIYPRIIPAVIVGVTNGDQILLTKYNRRDIAFYALIAGFTEIGETLEETVAREVMEEAGLKVKNIRYYKSQPWGIVDDLLAGFYCDVDGDPTIHIDQNELKEGVWVQREDIQGQPDQYSLTNEMMLLFRDGKEPKR